MNFLRQNFKEFCQHAVTSQSLCKPLILNGTCYRVLDQNVLQLHGKFGVPAVFHFEFHLRSINAFPVRSLLSGTVNTLFLGVLHITIGQHSLISSPSSYSPTYFTILDHLGTLEFLLPFYIKPQTPTLTQKIMLILMLVLYHQLRQCTLVLILIMINTFNNIHFVYFQHIHELH